MLSVNHFVVGGPAYRQSLHVQHATSLAQLAAYAAMGGPRDPKMSGVDYRHSSNLPQVRCLWLRDQIAQTSPKLKWAISVDSDQSFNAAHLMSELVQVDGQTAIGLAPVRIGGTVDMCNLLLDDKDEAISSDENALIGLPSLGRRIDWATELKSVLEGDRIIHGGGFGVAVFNLDWFRNVWPDPAPEYCSIATGEDTELCRSVRKRGGIIKALRVATDHFAWGEKQTR